MTGSGQHPLVSAIIPVFNGAAFLGDALDSIAAQEYEAVETIVVDDGSTDGSIDIARRHPIAPLCLSQPHQGAAAARNLGVGASRGELLAFLDADDIWRPGKLARQCRLLADRPLVDGALAEVREMGGSVQRNSDRPQPLPNLKTGEIPSAVMIRRSSFDRVGLFDVSRPPGSEAFDWMLRARELGLRFEIAPGAGIYRRLHERNTGATRREDQHLGYLQSIAESVARRTNLRTDRP